MYVLKMPRYAATLDKALLQFGMHLYELTERVTRLLRTFYKTPITRKAVVDALCIGCKNHLRTSFLQAIS